MPPPHPANYTSLTRCRDAASARSIGRSWCAGSPARAVNPRGYDQKPWWPPPPPPAPPPEPPPPPPPEPPPPPPPPCGSCGVAGFGVTGCCVWVCVGTGAWVVGSGAWVVGFALGATDG